MAEPKGQRPVTAEAGLPPGVPPPGSGHHASRWGLRPSQGEGKEKRERDNAK